MPSVPPHLHGPPPFMLQAVQLWHWPQERLTVRCQWLFLFGTLRAFESLRATSPGASMEIWTRQREQLGWTPWPDVPSGLASLVDVPDAQVLLRTEAPDVEHDLLVATLRLVQALAKDGNVVIASPHPSADWVESLKPFSVDQAWVVERRGARRPPAIENLSELVQGICPHLHTKTIDGTTLSVCGCHLDRMVLARHHLDRWCLLGDSECPHRRPGGSDV